VYGFYVILWKHLVEPLLAEGICLNLREARILHSGGWKRLQDQAVDKRCSTNSWLTCLDVPLSASSILWHGRECGSHLSGLLGGNKHGPVFGDVIVRNPLTLEPVAAGEHGIVQVCSVYQRASQATCYSLKTWPK